ncbi:MAG: hypothetical protein RLZZ546_2290 [Bacteroidota bacterium]|jgi:hypothetical protein
MIHNKLRIYFLYFFVLLYNQFITAQTVEVQGQLKLSTVNQNNGATDVLVRGADGSVGKRDASSIGGVPSSGIIMSDINPNTNLASNGFSLQGFETMFQSQAGGSGVNYGEWTDTISSINCPTSRNIPYGFWTGDKFIVWGGQVSNGGNNLDTTGAVYHPASNTWVTMNPINAPKKRVNNSGIVVIYALKYSKVNKAAIWFQPFGGTNLPMIHIIDAGVGFDINVEIESNGIINMTERANEINFEFYIKSNNEGTQITLTPSTNIL